MRRHKLDSPISYYAIYYFVRFVPRKLCRWLGRFVGTLVFVFSERDRVHLSRNFAVVLGKPWNHPQVRRAVRSVFLNYAHYLIDYFLFPQLNERKVRTFFSTVRGETFLKKALAGGKGALLVSGHIGNWEIGGNLLGSLGYPLTVVGLPHNTAQTNALVHHLRKVRGIEIIEVGDTAFSVVEILNALRKNRIVAMIGDRDHLGTGRLVSFLGKQMRLPPGPVVLSMISGAPLMPTFVLDNHDGTYSGFIEPPIPIESGRNRDRIIDHGLRRLARVFETYISRYPDQWYCPDPLIEYEQAPPAAR